MSFKTGVLLESQDLQPPFYKGKGVGVVSRSVFLTGQSTNIGSASGWFTERSNRLSGKPEFHLNSM